MRGEFDLLWAAVLAGMVSGGGLVPRAWASEMKDPLAARTDLVAGNSAFALDLYERLRAEPGNLFFSPFSISTALGMTYAGARAHTEQEMAAVLHFTLPQPELHAAMGRLSGELVADSGSELLIANRLWIQAGEKLLDGFLQVNREHYGATPAEVDFEHQSESTRATINAWISAQTRERIPELLQKGDINAATALVLTNAIYFKGAWAQRFDAAQTQAGPFQAGPGRTADVPMMQQVGRFAHARGADFAALELPYEGGRLAMVILLPDAHDGLAGLERQLSPERIATCLAQLAEKRVSLSVPRLKLRSRCNLAATLAAMGMPSAFGPEADFSGITGTRDLFIDKVIHEAEIEVSEEGSEASAATAVTMERTGIPSVPIEFHADHPFLFLIRDRESGAILFMGRVAEP
jgi:serpin B